MCIRDRLQTEHCIVFKIIIRAITDTKRLNVNDSEIAHVTELKHAHRVITPTTDSEMLAPRTLHLAPTLNDMVSRLTDYILQLSLIHI